MTGFDVPEHLDLIEVTIRAKPRRGWFDRQGLPDTVAIFSVTKAALNTLDNPRDIIDLQVYRAITQSLKAAKEQWGA